MRAVSLSMVRFDSGVDNTPSGGCSGFRLGIGMGMGARVSWFWMNTMGSTPAVGSKLKLRFSTLVSASMSTLSAGWGTPILISGPK